MIRQFYRATSYYDNTEILNLTSTGHPWDIRFSKPDVCPEFPAPCNDSAEESLTRTEVLPLHEFPLKGWQPGDWIYYRTNVIIPEKLRNSPETLVLHSFYLWGDHYDLYFNGTLVSAGRSGPLSVDIPPEMIVAGEPLRIALRVNPGTRSWQGLSHYGAIAIGEKHRFLPVQKLMYASLTERPYWGLLPRLTICLLFCFIYFIYDRRKQILWFVAFLSLNSLSLFFYTDYAMSLLPENFDYGPTLSLIEIVSWAVLFQYFLSFFEISLQRWQQLLNSALSIGFCAVGLVLFAGLPGPVASPYLDAWGALCVVFVHGLGAVFGLWRLRHPTDETRGRRVAYLVLLSLCLIAILGQGLEMIGALTTAALPFEVTYGLLLFFAMTFSTVTHMGQTVEQKRKFEREVERQAHELAQSEVDRAVARTSLMIAHDLRKPFSMLRMLLGSMREETGLPDKESVALLSKKAENAAAQIEGLLQDLLSIRGTENTPNERVLLAPLIENLAESTRAFYESSKAQIQLKLTPDLAVYGNQREIERLFSNLIHNAYEATGANGNIWVHSRRVNSRIQLTVGNSQSFIPHALQDRIFDLFYTENKPGGTGIGLAACKKIVSKHKGTLHCRSSEQTGTEFIVELPAAVEALSGPALPRKQNSPLPLLALIDDDPFVQSLWRTSLKDAELRIYSTPEECLRDLKSSSNLPSFFVTDFNFATEMNGAELSARIRMVHPEARIFSSSDSRFQPLQHEVAFDGILEKRVYSFQELSTFRKDEKRQSPSEIA